MNKLLIIIFISINIYAAPMPDPVKSTTIQRGNIVDKVNTNTTTSISNATTGVNGDKLSSGQITNSNGTESMSKSDIQKQKMKAMKYPLTQNLINSTEWPVIMSELEITMDLGSCGTGIKFAPGLAAHMIDFEGYWERVRKPLNFPFMGINLGGNIIKTGTPFESNDSGGDTPKTQVTNSHFISVPLLGMIFKKKMSFWCLNSGDIDIPYISEFDITYKYDYMSMKTIPHMIAMFSPDTLITTVFDCAATEVLAVNYGNATSSELSFDQYDTNGERDSMIEKGTDNGKGSQGTMQKWRSSGADVAKGIVNSLYFIDGCNGFSPVGGYEDGNDPITDSHNSFHGAGGILFGATALNINSQFKKKSNFTYLKPQGMPNPPNPVDTMCAPKSFALFMPSQYVLQQAYPTVGTSKECGQDAVTTSSMHNLPGAEGQVFVLWGRRDYYAFAYFCPSAKKDK